MTCNPEAAKAREFASYRGNVPADVRSTAILHVDKNGIFTPSQIESSESQGGFELATAPSALCGWGLKRIDSLEAVWSMVVCITQCLNTSAGIKLLCSQCCSNEFREGVIIHGNKYSPPVSSFLRN